MALIYGSYPVAILDFNNCILLFHLNSTLVNIFFLTYLHDKHTFKQAHHWVKKYDQANIVGLEMFFYKETCNIYVWFPDLNKYKLVSYIKASFNNIQVVYAQPGWHTKSTNLFRSCMEKYGITLLT